MREKKQERELERIRQRILAGGFGAPGDRFMTTRELGGFCGVSLVTAQHIMARLKADELIVLHGKHYFLSYGRLEKNTPLSKRRGKSGLIGLHIVNLDNPYFSSLARAVETSAHQNGYEVIIASSGYSFTEERSALRLFERLGVDGVISSPSRGQMAKELYSRYRLPFVFLSGAVDGVDADRVLINNYAGGKSVAEHFVENGYRSFLYIAPETMKNRRDVRLEGFADGLQQHGFRLNPDDVVYAGSNGRSLPRYVGRMLASCEKPVGIFCYHDLLAAEAVRLCRQNGFAVPQDVGISGYDNIRLMGDVVPALTSVDYRINRLASIAVELAIRRINGGTGASERHLVDTVLIVRESSSRGGASDQKGTEET